MALIRISHATVFKNKNDGKFSEEIICESLAVDGFSNEPYLGNMKQPYFAEIMFPTLSVKTAVHQYRIWLNHTPQKSPKKPIEEIKAHD